MSQCIVVVDDDRDVRDLLRSMLEREGYSVVAAGGGREALERIEALCGQGPAAPDLVITDLAMPGLDGLALLSLLRGVAPRVAAMVISGGSRIGLGEAVETALRLGAREVVQKPFTRAEMITAVHRVLAGRAG